MFWSKLKLQVKPKEAISTCNHGKTCPRCGCPLDGLTLVCPRCREPIPNGCSGKCASCNGKTH